MTGDEHAGDLRESSYGFQCWIKCACGWRSRSYPTSAAAWTAHATHQWQVQLLETITVLPDRPHG